MPNYNLGASSAPCGPEGTNQLGITNYEIKVFPNPANTMVHVQCSNSNIINQVLQINNVLGELVYKTTIKSTNTDVDISILPKGIYFVKVGLQSAKFVKN